MGDSGRFKHGAKIQNDNDKKNYSIYCMTKPGATYDLGFLINHNTKYVSIFCWSCGVFHKFVCTCGRTKREFKLKQFLTFPIAYVDKYTKKFMVVDLKSIGYPHAKMKKIMVINNGFENSTITFKDVIKYYHYAERFKLLFIYKSIRSSLEH